MNLKTMRICQKNSWEGSSTKIRAGGPGFGYNSEPRFSSFLKNFFIIGPSTNIHDLRTSCLEHILHVHPSTINRTLNYLILR